MSCFMFIIKNMIITEMNIQMSRGAIPFLIISGVSMVMRACLNSFPTMDTAMGWWGCFPIILFPQRFQWCLRRIWHLREFSFGVSRTDKLRSQHNLKWLSYVLVINTKLVFLLMPHPCKEPHVCPCNWDLQISNRNHTMWRWNWKEINIFYLLYRCGKNWWGLFIIYCWWFTSCLSEFTNFLSDIPKSCLTGQFFYFDGVDNASAINAQALSFIPHFLQRFGANSCGMIFENSEIIISKHTWRWRTTFYLTCVSLQFFQGLVFFLQLS